MFKGDRQAHMLPFLERALGQEVQSARAQVPGDPDSFGEPHRHSQAVSGGRASLQLRGRGFHRLSLWEGERRRNLAEDMAFYTDWCSRLSTPIGIGHELDQPTLLSVLEQPHASVDAQL